MKKLLMTAAVLACAASIVSAQTVSSANIVGYSKKALTSGQFLMVSPQFQGTAAGTTLGEAFVGQNDQSVVFTWDGSVYTKYTYYAGFAWYDNAFQDSDNVLIGEGDAVWLADSSGGADAIMSGEVPSADSITNSLVVGFNMVANPYPVALQLGDIPTASLTDQDVIFTWDGATYTKYTYYAGFAWYDNAFTDSTTVEIAVGDGFWLDSAAGGSLILDKQY
jgi:hypothetical protein